MSAKYAFSQTLKEVRFLFCQTGAHSDATRSFLARTYPTMKKHNPNTPILLREAAGTQPKVYARYEFGREVSEELAGLSDKEIEDKVTESAEARRRCTYPADEMKIELLACYNKHYVMSVGTSTRRLFPFGVIIIIGKRV
ncbi:hypothetical protein EYC84_000923 [Monilinia fructicola]|uniref:Ribosomal protein/NADH dehydrogenase domain-containing protein n=1 Tax=Monilinia fructicola TaxID=38448 RepID=A0A5M9JKS9_MONFR|nr:hypothetical protein EYC84_000923 [Monilinia fructicola]